MLWDEPRTGGSGSCPPHPPAPPSAHFKPGWIPKVARCSICTWSCQIPEVPTSHHLGLSRSLRVQPAPLSLVSPANLLKVHSLPSSLSLTKIVNFSCTSVIPGSPFPFGWDSTGLLGRVWPAGQGGDPAPLPCPREAVLHSTTQERRGAAGEGQGGHKDDSESGACLLMRRDCRSLA